MYFMSTPSRREEPTVPCINTGSGARRRGVGAVLAAAVVVDLAPEQVRDEDRLLARRQAAQRQAVRAGEPPDVEHGVRQEPGGVLLQLLRGDEQLQAAD